ncbi:MAG: T9SS type A sorting domain-containing protein, partial [Syntrophothermus sp.]
GDYWYDSGFIWVMYRAMALDFNYNPNSPWVPGYGVWDNSVFTVEPLVDYEPLLTMKTSLSHTCREMISVRAGISSNTRADFPEHLINFPIWNFQGGPYPVNATYPGPEAVEAGFDITPLLSYVNPGDTAKLFFLLEEQDKNHNGSGLISEATFISYKNGNAVSQAAGSGKEIEDNAVTILPVLITPDFSKPAITTLELPSFDPSQNYSVQMEATGGNPAYTWSVLHPFLKIETDSVFPQDVNTIAPIVGLTIPYHKVVLPFPFEFYGKRYDTVYMNAYGFLCFTPDAIPDYYVSDPEQTIRNYPMISGAYSRDGNISHPGTGMWYKEGDHEMTFRWKIMMSHSGAEMNFAIRLYDDGRFEIRYDHCTGDNRLNISSSGYSAGDDNDFDVWTNWKPEEMSGRSYLVIPSGPPSSVNISPGGELTASGLDTGKIYDLMVEVKDENQISGVKNFLLGKDLLLEASLTDKIMQDQNIPVKLSLKNTSAEALTGLVVSMTTSTTGVTIKDSTENIPTLAPGETLEVPAAFLFRADSAFPDQYPVRFGLNATNGTRSWQRETSFPFSGPALTCGSPVIHDGVDGFLDPGEVAEMFIDVNNVGSAALDSVEFQLTVPGNEIAVLDSADTHQISLDALDRTKLRFMLSASRSLNTGDTVPLSLTGYRKGKMVKNVGLYLVTGRIRTALVNLSGTTLSAMDSALTALNISHYNFDYLPDFINNYTYTFVMMGSGQLNSNERYTLLSYPDSCRNLYMEGYVFWKFSMNSDFREVFHDSIQTPVTPYSVQRINGVTGTPAASMTFSYDGIPATSNYKFIPLEPAYSLLETPVQRSVVNVYPAENYTLISSIIQFEQLADSIPPSDRISLMKKYLGLMGMQVEGPKAFFHCDRTSISYGDSLHFYDDSFDDITGWQWEFEGATPPVSTDKNPVVKYPVQGTYDVKLTVTNAMGSTLVEKKDFIHVGMINSIEENFSGKSLVIWPNPAADHLWIRTSSENNHLEIYNLQGKKMMDEHFTGKTGSVNLHGLPSGMYILIVNGIRTKMIRS